MLAHREVWYRDDASSHDIIWNTNCDALLEHARIYGTCNVPYRKDCRMPDGTVVKLGKWLSNQRQLQLKNALPPDREARLQALVAMGKLDWYLDPAEVCSEIFRDDEQWDTMFRLLEEYCASHQSSCSVPKNHEVSVLPGGRSVRLGKWLLHQKELFHKGKLIEYRKSRLLTLVECGKLKWDFKLKH